MVAKWSTSSLEEEDVTSSQVGVHRVILIKASSHKALEPSAVDRMLRETGGGEPDNLMALFNFDLSELPPELSCFSGSAPSKLLLYWKRKNSLGCLFSL